MTFGPDLPDGRRLLLMVSDDNFSDEQRTQVVAFAVEPSAL
jgi:3-phytase